MKKSYYNFIYNDLGKDKIIMYNSRTGAVSLVKEEQFEQFNEFSTSNKNIEDKDFLKNLLKCGYIIPDKVDELYLLKSKIIRSRCDTKSLRMTIAPTMACNFRCIYCFEKDNYGYKEMSDITIKNLLTFIKKQIEGVKEFHISWFGGEPLLALPIIEKISKIVIELCKEKNIVYTANITTNGYLYTKQTAELLKKYCVDTVQITLDGSKEIHDARRCLCNGQGTYEVIMNNLISTKGIIPVHIRINVDKTNIDAIDSIMQFIDENQLRKTVFPYLACVLPYNGSYEENSCLSFEVFSKYNFNFIYKYNMMPNGLSLLQPKGKYCIADYSNGWIVDNNGEIYKCTCEIGDIHRKFGNVNNETNYIENTDIIKQFCDYEPTNDMMCKECKFLPICMGGCPHNRMFGMERCTQLRYQIHDYIVEYVKTILLKNNM